MTGASSVQAVEQHAMALYAAGDLEGCLATWQREHARCAASGEHEQAAHAAVMTAMFLLIDTALLAPVRGWLSRAERSLGDLEAGPVRALVAALRGYERLLSGDVDGCRQHAALAVRLGEEHHVVPAAVLGQVAQCRLLVLDGSADAAVEALNDAGARLLSGEVDDLTVGMMLCEVVCAAQNLGLSDLAREWTDLMDGWRAGTAVGGIHGRCRVHRAELLRLSGPCDEAEAEALAACEELRPWMQREYGWPLVELGTIRLRKGDLEGAEDAFAAAHDLAWPAQPGLALLGHAQGELSAAAKLVADAIENPPDLPWKERPPTGDLRLAPLLDAQAEIAAAQGDAPTCQSAAARLQQIARAFGSRSLAAMADLARARAMLMQGRTAEARRLAADAASTWADLGAPYETASARVVAGEALQALGNQPAAALEHAAARRLFTAYGAGWRAPQPDEGTDRGTSATTTIRGTFRREGKMRVIGLGDARVTVPDLLGLRYVEHLLRHSGREVPAAELVQREHPGATVSQLGLPALDEQARRAYRQRLLDIDEDVAEATQANDLGRVAAAERDREFLLAELSRATGLGGRIREVGGDAEKARTSVFRAIRYAVERAVAADSRLGEHLRRSIRTGTCCAYRPDPLTPVSWEL